MMTTEMTSTAREYQELTAHIRELQDHADALKNALTTELHDRGVDTYDTGIYLIKWTHYTSTRIDAQTLKQDLPKVYDAYLKTTQARRFSIA